jgi:beta-lactamase family protein
MSKLRSLMRAIYAAAHAGGCHSVAGVARLAAFAALVTALLAAGPAPARAPGGELPGSAASGVYPDLRSVGELAAPGLRQVDSGVGVYPSLTAPPALGFPGADAVRAARRFAAGRRGTIAFAVTDGLAGVQGVGVDRRFHSASLSKAMILVQFLRQSAASGTRPTPGEVATLGYMIRVSDNDSAERMYHRVGDEGLRDLARRAGMAHFAVSGDWANATLTAGDQARFFLRLDDLVPPRFRELARDMLEGVAPFQTWGIPTAARPRWRAFFKGGWRPDPGGVLVHQGAFVERGSRRVGLAVLTSGNPDQPYGERTIQGVARRLLAPADAPIVAALPPLTEKLTARPLVALGRTAQ